MALLKIHPVNHHTLQRLTEELQLKQYSLNTLKTYQNEFIQLLYILKDKNVDDLNADAIKSYLLFCINELKLSENQIHSRLNAIKFYFSRVLKQEKMLIEIPRPKKPSQLPKTINAQNIKKLFAVTVNLKHNTMLKLCYGKGLGYRKL